MFRKIVKFVFLSFQQAVAGQIKAPVGAGKMITLVTVDRSRHFNIQNYILSSICCNTSTLELLF